MEHDDFYATIVRNSSDAIVSHDLEGRITSWNLGAELLTGFTEKQMKGQPINNLFTEENRKLYWSHVGKLTRSNPAAPPMPKGGSLPSGSSTMPSRSASTNPPRSSPSGPLKAAEHLPFDLQLLCLNKALLPVSVTVSEIGGETKETAEICLIARDISRQKETEDHINELYNTVSHELRTPLTSLQGALSVLDEGMVSLTSADAKEMIRVAREGSDRLLKIVCDILDFRRLESNETPLSLSVVRTDDIIDQSILAVKSLADERGVQLSRAVAQETFVSADKDRIIQVMINLLTNAINHSEKGEKVQILAVLRRSGAVRISVIDNGPGITPEHKKRIFQKFHRIDPSSTRTLRGTGLGLAMCKLIIDQHEGAIGLDSAPGKGSTFWFELKALGASSRPAGTVVANAVKNCLIVSDDRDAIEALHKRLTKQGIGCRLVQPGDAVAVARSHKPNAVLVDLAAVGTDIFKLINDMKQVGEEVKTIAFRRSAQEGTFSHPTQLDGTAYGALSAEEKTRAILGLQKQELRCCLRQDDFLAETLSNLE